MGRRDCNSLMKTFITVTQMIPHCLGILIQTLLGSPTGPIYIFGLVLEYCHSVFSGRTELEFFSIHPHYALYSPNHSAFFP